MNNKKILLIDDEEDIIEMLEIALKMENFKNILKAFNGNQGIDMFKKENPDIIILDIMLPDMDGYQICKEIREISMVPILFLSAKNEEIDKLLSFALGGDDYIEKPFSTKEMVYRIKAILKRQMFNKQKNNEDIKVGDIEINIKNGIVKKNGKCILLTAMEFKLLSYFIINKEIVLSKNTIIENVWETDFDGYDNTLMVHIRHLREKIEDDPKNPHYIQTIKNMGYKFLG